jgi:hypothetical protein
MGETIEKLGRRRTGVRLAPCPSTKLDKRVRLLTAGSQKAARTMIFERAADQLDVVRNERRGERIAGQSRVGMPVERKLQRPVAVDKTASLQPAHGLVSIASNAPATAWVRVSRVTVSHERHPLAWYQSSWISPAGFSRM